MRSDQEMMDIILTFAKNDDCIRVVTMEGSKLNKNAPVDIFQDFDIKFIVNNMEKYLKNDDWLNIFGKRIIMQKPEAMPMFPPVWLDGSNRFSYLMLFEDGNKIDLGIVPINELKQYFIKTDSLTKILIDKDNICPIISEPSDIDFHIKKPSAEFVDNCCTEFWFLSIYVTKGLCRSELIYAIKHLDMLRDQMLTMVSWKVGIDTLFSLSVGKSYKYLEKYVPIKLWESITKTYKINSIEDIWDSFILCCNIFQEITNFVTNELKYKCHKYNKKVIEYIKEYIPKEKLEKIKML